MAFPIEKSSSPGEDIQWTAYHKYAPISDRVILWKDSTSPSYTAAEE